MSARSDPDLCDLAAYLWLAREALARVPLLGRREYTDRQDLLWLASVDLRRAVALRRGGPWEAVLGSIEATRRDRVMPIPATVERWVATLDAELAGLRLSGVLVPEEVTA